MRVALARMDRAQTRQRIQKTAATLTVGARRTRPESGIGAAEFLHNAVVEKT
jgi:hypothetical protein